MESVKLQDNYDWYINYKEELLQVFGGKFLIIDKLQVVGSFDTRMEAYEMAVKIGLGSVLIHQCLADEPVQMFTSPVFAKRKMWDIKPFEINSFLRIIDPNYSFIRFQLDNLDVSDKVFAGQQRGIWYTRKVNNVDSPAFLPFSNISWIKFCYELNNVDLSDALIENVKSTNELNQRLKSFDSILSEVIRISESKQSYRAIATDLQEYLTINFK